MDICRVVSHGPFCSRPRLSYHKLCLAYPLCRPSDCWLQKRSHFSGHGNANVRTWERLTLFCEVVLQQQRKKSTRNYFELSGCLSQGGLWTSSDSIQKTGHGRSGPGATANKTVPARRATLWPDSTAVAGRPPLTPALSVKSNTMKSWNSLHSYATVQIFLYFYYQPPSARRGNRTGKQTVQFWSFLKGKYLVWYAEWKACRWKHKLISDHVLWQSCCLFTNIVLNLWLSCS